MTITMLLAFLDANPDYRVVMSCRNIPFCNFVLDREALKETLNTYFVPTAHIRVDWDHDEEEIRLG